MAQKRLFILMLAVLAALALTGCALGSDSTVDHSTPEVLQTFGVQVNPSAEPSMGQVMPELPMNTGDVSTEDAVVSGQDTQFTDTSVSTPPPATEPSPTATATAKPTSNPTTVPTVEPSPSNSPTIAPPAPVSSATVDDVMDYVGESLSKLIEDMGYPSSSDYELVDQEDPAKGEIGTLYFTDFVVKTLRENGVETITSVTPKESPSPETSPEASPAE